MLVAINAVHVVPHSGLEDLFIRHLMPAMAQLPEPVSCFVLTDPVNHDTFEGVERRCVESGQARKAIEPALRSVLADSGADRLLTLPGNVPAATPCPVVPLMLNLRPLYQPRSFFSWWGEVRMKQVTRALQRAKAIVTPSDYARKVLLEKLSVPLDKAVVAQPGVDHLDGAARKATVEPPYLLSVGLGQAPEGLAALLTAFEALEDRIPHSLVVVGEPGENEPEISNERVVRIHQCPTDQRIGLYQHADLVVQADPDDVSGYLVLEAAFAGGRVMAPRGGAVAAVAPGVAISCDPGNTKAFASAILHALGESDEQCRSRVKAGKHIASEYTWQRCAGRVLTALKRA